MILNGDLGRDLNKDPARLVVSERKSLVGTVLSPNTSMDQSENEKLILHIKKNTNPTPIPIDLVPYMHFRIEDLVKVICAPEVEANKIIRLIYQGKQLKDDDRVKDIKFKPETVMHIFISEPVQKDVNITTISAELYEPERRGFDKFRPLDLMEEEIILFRGKFHSKYILLAEKNLINENELYKHEEEWLKCNEEHLVDADMVRQTMKNYSEEEGKEEEGTTLSFLIGILLGVILNVVLMMVMVFTKIRSPQFIKGSYIGMVLFFCAIFTLRALQLL